MDSDTSRTEVLAATVPAKPGFRRLWYRGTQRWSTGALAIAILLLVLGGGIFWRSEHKTAPPSAAVPLPATTAADARPPMASTSKMLPDRPSLAVLPFDSSSENGYFADGITVEHRTIRPLPALESWSLRATPVRPTRASPSRCAGRNLRALRVGGSVRREGATPVASMRSLSTRSVASTWAERYDGSIRDAARAAGQGHRANCAALAVSPLRRTDESDLSRPETRKPTMRCFGAGHTYRQVPRMK
jgi:TolB-like protein